MNSRPPSPTHAPSRALKLVLGLSASLWLSQAEAQLTDLTRAPNVANEGIRKSFADQVGKDRGSVTTPNSSLFNIRRDPFRAIRRGRQIFQRKFTMAEGVGPISGDGAGEIGRSAGIGAGLTDSCAACHGRPRGGAGFGGNVVTRPDSRDTPHLYGLGLIEMLADEMTKELRTIRAQALEVARQSGQPKTRALTAKGVGFGSLTAHPDGRVDTGGVQGVNPDLRIRPFFAQGSVFSIRAFVVGALNAEMGLEAVDGDLDLAASGRKVVTPSGFEFDGAVDAVGSAPAAHATDDPDADGKAHEIPTALVDYLEFYLLNEFRPGTHQKGATFNEGLAKFRAIGCDGCHVQNLKVDNDRRVVDASVSHDPANGVFNGLFATVTPRVVSETDNPALPSLKRPKGGSFIVENLFSDLKRHDIGPGFWERNFNGSVTKSFVTEPLWGVGTTSPYGHDGRSINLQEVILRHGGEALQSRNNFAALSLADKNLVLGFLNALVLYPPDDTASNLAPANRSDALFPQKGHGSIDLTPLFNDRNDPE